MAGFRETEAGQIVKMPGMAEGFGKGKTKGGGFRLCFPYSVCKASTNKGFLPGLQPEGLRPAFLYAEKTLMIAGKRKEVETKEFKDMRKKRSITE